MNRAPFHGIFPYLISPLDDRGKTRESVLHDLVGGLIQSGVHGLSPLGSTGEFPYLTPEQRIDVVRAVVRAAAARVPVVPGVAAYATGDAVRQIDALLECGVDGVILILQAYFPLSPGAVTDFYASVAEAVSRAHNFGLYQRLYGLVRGDLPQNLADLSMGFSGQLRLRRDGTTHVKTLGRQAGFDARRQRVLLKEFVRPPQPPLQLEPFLPSTRYR